MAIAMYALRTASIDRESPEMIVDYADKRTERFTGGEIVREFESIEQPAEKRLSILNAAAAIESLRALPSTRLPSLGGRRRGQYSIRINRRWRICFNPNPPK